MGKENMNPQALLNTVVYMVGLYFALRSSNEHRNLRFEPSQIQMCEREGEHTFFILKIPPKTGLKGRHVTPEIVQHHTNTANPERCFVTLFKKYKSLCPDNRKKNTPPQTTANH